MEAPGSAQDLYRAWPDLLRLPAGGGAELVYVPPARAAHVLGPERVRLLLACRGFATLEQHAARIATQAGGALATVRAELAELARAGLLVPAGALVRGLREAGPPAVPPRIARIGVPTRDRVPELRAALASYLENARAHGRSPEIVVADDATTAEGRAETRAAAAELAARYHVPIAYAGLEEKTRYAAALAEHARVPRALVELAILNPERCPLTFGANQNVLLLHGAGEPMVEIDDDTRCRLAPAPGQLAGLALTSQDDPSELWFPGPGAPALPPRVLVERDYLALHEELLGRTVGACVEQARRHGLDLDRASGAFFRRLEPHGGRVVCTQTGAAGDSGTGSMWHYLLLGGPSRERLLASEPGYRHAFTGRRVVRAAPRAAIGDGTFCMSMSLGLDGRSLLPPFFPVQRNADGIFGVVLRVAWPDAFLGFVPWVVEHAPARPRASPFDEFFGSLGHAGCNDLVCLLVASSSVESRGADPARSLRALGEVLERWGSLPLADFEEIVRVQALRARSLDLGRLEDALGQHGRSPAFWARDVERAAAILREALPRPSLGYPADLVAAFGEEAARALFPRLLRRFGELLRVWPDLFAAAVELAQKGVRPGVAVSP